MPESVMADETRIGKVEDRVTEIEKREAGRDVKVEIATGAMNRLTGLVGAAGIVILGAVVTFILTGSN